MDDFTSDPQWVEAKLVSYLQHFASRGASISLDLYLCMTGGYACVLLESPWNECEDEGTRLEARESMIQSMTAELHRRCLNLMGDLDFVAWGSGPVTLPERQGALAQAERVLQGPAKRNIQVRKLNAGWSSSDIPSMANDVLNDLSHNCRAVCKVHRYGALETESVYEGRYFFGSGELPPSTYRVSRAATAYVKAVKAGLIRFEDLLQFSNTQGERASRVAERRTRAAPESVESKSSAATAPKA